MVDIEGGGVEFVCGFIVLSGCMIRYGVFLW